MIHFLNTVCPRRMPNGRGEVGCVHMQAERNVEVTRQSLCRDTTIHVKVTAHILRFCPVERYPTVMPLAPDHVRLSRNVLAFAPCLRHFVVSKDSTIDTLRIFTHQLLVKHTETQQHVKTHHVSPSQSPEEIHLNTAIEQASRTQLCHIVRQLCAHSKTATEMTRDYLIPIPEKIEAPKQVVPRSILKKPGSSKRKAQSQWSPSVQSTSLLNETPPSSQMQSQGNVKRKATTQCRNCGSEYTSASNDALACVHHPGT